MSQIAVRLTEDELNMLDSAVAQGDFHSRAEAVRAGVRLLGLQLRESRIAASYRSAYSSMPLDEDERAVLDAAAALVGDAVR